MNNSWSWNLNFGELTKCEKGFLSSLIDCVEGATDASFFCVTLSFVLSDYLPICLFIPNDTNIDSPQLLSRWQQVKAIFVTKYLFNLGYKNNSEISQGSSRPAVSQSQVCRCFWARLKQEIIFPNANNIQPFPCLSGSFSVFRRSKIIKFNVSACVLVVNVAISLIDKLRDGWENWVKQTKKLHCFLLVSRLTQVWANNHHHLLFKLTTAPRHNFLLNISTWTL